MAFSLSKSYMSKCLSTLSSAVAWVKIEYVYDDPNDPDISYYDEGVAPILSKIITNNSELQILAKIAKGTLQGGKVYSIKLMDSEDNELAEQNDMYLYDYKDEDIIFVIKIAIDQFINADGIGAYDKI